MKKLRKFVLSSNISCLPYEEQATIVGGEDVDPNVCHAKTHRDQCHGSCVTYDGLYGYCGWVNKYSQCMCATISIG